MNPGLIGLIGGIVGGIVGVAGGLLGTYFSIKNTNGPRERAFVIKASIVGWIFVLTFVSGMCLTPGLYKLFLVPIYVVVLVAGILLWNKKQTQIRLEESKKNPAPLVAPATQIIPRKCPQCGAELKPDVSEGLCPACLLQRGIATEGGAPPGTPPFVPPTIRDLARLFPQLEILELIGKGGMGAVYKARQPALDRFVALKILAPRAGGDLDFASRFTREARALAKLSHPNIVAVYDFGIVGQASSLSPSEKVGEKSETGRMPVPLHYFIMEYVDGPNLRQIEQAGKLPPREALEIIPQICAALQFAHDEGIVHRDIKPENVLLDKKGRVKIADFGLAKILGQESKDFRLTGARDVVGTPHYMAPEQIEKPQTVDHRADIYSLGVVFYEMLTGELPLGKFQPPSQKVQVDVRLDEVVLRSLAKEPELRYQHVSEVKTRVETIASTTAPAATPTMSAGEILARDYALNIRSCLRRGWALVRNDFWPLVGMSAFVMVVLSAASSSGVVLSDGKSSGTTSILGILLSGPFMGGLYLYFLKKIRREAAGVETAFTGFRHPFPHLVIGGFLATLLTTLGFLCLILPGIYLFTAWIFTFPLIVDRRLDFWPAMQLSRKIISKHWWKFLGFLLVLGLVNLVGIAACCVGLFITFPITFAALTYAYEDIIGAAKSPAGVSSSIPPIAPPTPPAPQPDRFWQRFAVVMACVILISVAIAILGMLAAIAIPNFVRARQHAQALHEQVETPKQPAGQNAAMRSEYIGKALSFGPVMERVIQARQTGTNSFLDLDSGRLFTPPPDVVNSLTAVQPTDNAERFWQGLDILDNTRPFRYIAWLRESGADIMFNDKEQIIAFEGCFVVAHGESSTNWDDWAGLSPKTVCDAVKAIESATRDTQSGVTIVGPGAESSSYTSAMRLYSRSSGGPAVQLLTREQSVLWFFKTRDGGLGILQIAGFTENPRGVKIRYKLVQRTGSATNALAASAETWSPTLAPGEKPDTTQTLADQPPVVVTTWPVSGALDVETGVTEIRVRFSKEMADGSWSWSTAWENSTPETVGHIHYETDQRTCVLKAKLEPGRTYAWWLNSDKFKNFTDLAGRPAVPYLLIFQTKPN
jgi:serine/threonine protein kinase